MKKIKTFIVALAASLMMVTSCSNLPNLNNMKEDAIELVSKNLYLETDPAKIVEDFVQLSKENTEAWVVSVASMLEGMEEAEVAYYKYNHFKSEFDNLLLFLPLTVKKDVLEYIAKNYYYTVNMYEGCSKMICWLMNEKVVKPELTESINQLYKRILNFVRSSNVDEQHGFAIFVDVVIKSIQETAGTFFMGPGDLVEPIYIAVFFISMVDNFSKLSEADQKLFFKFVESYADLFITSLFSAAYDAINYIRNY